MPWTADPVRGGFTTGVPWEPLADGTATANVAVESPDPDSLLSTYRSLVRLRDAHPGLRVGATIPVAATGPVAAWIRATAEDVELVLANASDTATSDYSLSLDAGPLCAPRTTAALLAAVNVDAGTTVVPPTTTAAGGFASYRPIGTLPAHAGVVIDLGGS
jgi:alpha-glucosidase